MATENRHDAGPAPARASHPDRHGLEAFHGNSSGPGWHVELDDLADAAVPLSLVAFDLNAGTEAVLCEGPAVDAIVAACSIPGIFPPVAIGEQLLVDGGVVNSVCVS